MCEAGVSMVEGALILPLFIGLALVGVDLLRLAYHWVSLQYLAERAMRRAVIAGTTATDVQSFIVEHARAVSLTVQPANIALCPISAAPCPGIANVGQSNDMLQLVISVPADGFILGQRALVGRLRLTISATTRGERENPA